MMSHGFLREVSIAKGRVPVPYSERSPVLGQWKYMGIRTCRQTLRTNCWFPIKGNELVSLGTSKTNFSAPWERAWGGWQTGTTTQPFCHSAVRFIGFEARGIYSYIIHDAWVSAVWGPKPWWCSGCLISEARTRYIVIGTSDRRSLGTAATVEKMKARVLGKLIGWFPLTNCTWSKNGMVCCFLIT